MIDAVLSAGRRAKHRVLEAMSDDGDGIRRLLTGAGWALSGAVLSRLLGLATAVLVARLLASTEFGVYGIVQTTAGMFATFAGFGLGTTSTRFVASLQKTDSSRVGAIVGLGSATAAITGSIMAAALYGGADWLAVTLLNDIRIAGPLRLSALGLVFQAVNGAQLGALAGFEAFRAATTVNVIAAISSLVCIVAGVALGGIEGAVLGGVAGAAAAFVVGHRTLRRVCKQRNALDDVNGVLRELPLLWRFALPALLSGLLLIPINWWCAAYLTRVRGLHQMGLFAAANQWYSALLFLPGVLSQVLLPILASQISQKAQVGRYSALRISIAVNAVVLIPISALVAAFAGPISRIYGPSYHDAAAAIALTAITAAVVAVQAPVGNLVVAHGRFWLGFAMNLVWAITFIVGTYVLAERGASGVAGARLGAYVIHLVSTLVVARIIVGSRAESGTDGDFVV